MHIAVLMGGWSLEREVSLSSAKGIIEAIKELGYKVTPVDVTGDLTDLLNHLKKSSPDVIFNALHGIGGEDGVIQGVLEMLQIPYTHSGVTASAIAMDKILSRQIFSYQGIPVPDWKIISFDDFKHAHPMDFPYVVKPVKEGSSFGVSLIFTELDYQKALNTWSFGNQILVEKYIPGREIQVAVIDGKAIGSIEIQMHSGFYDYEAKYTPGRTTHLVPAPLNPKDEKEILKLAEKAYQTLGCRGASRVDFRCDDTKEHINFYLLELNTHPGMTPLSLVPEIAAHNGMSFKDLIQIMIQTARCDGKTKFAKSSSSF